MVEITREEVILRQSLEDGGLRTQNQNSTAYSTKDTRNGSDRNKQTKKSFFRGLYHGGVPPIYVVRSLDGEARRLAMVVTWWFS